MRRRSSLLALLALSSACESGALSGPQMNPETQRRLKEARAAALSEDPSSLLKLGQIEIEAGLLFNAADTLQKAQNKGAKSAALFASMAQTYVDLGYPESAISALRSCFKENPAEPNCLYAFGALIQSDPSDGAQREVQLAWSRFALVAAPDHPRRGYVESALAQLNGRFGPLSPDKIWGRPSSQPASTSSTTPSASAQTSSISPHSAGDIAREDVGELNPFGVTLGQAYAAWQKRDTTAAEAAFRRALELRPNDAPTMAELSRLLLDTGKNDDAETLVNKAWTLDSSHPQVRFAFGLIMLHGRKRAEEALEAWRALMRDNPDYARQAGVERLLKEVAKDATSATP